MIRLTQRTYNEINREIASRLVTLRKKEKLSQPALAKKSGVSFASIRRFEETGEISLASLTKIAIALHAEDDMDRIFSEVRFNSIEEVIRGQQ